MELNLSFLKHTFILALQGIPTACLITFLSLLIAAIPAYFMALARLYRIKIVSPLSSLYVSFIRGTPMVVQILIIYSLLPSLINFIAKKCGSSFNVFEMNPVVYAVTVFSLHTIASLSEVIRSSITTVDNGQLDASFALGMNPLQAYRLIILPHHLNLMSEIHKNLTTYVVYDTDAYSYDTILRIFSVSPDDNIRLGTYNRKTRI